MDAVRSALAVHRSRVTELLRAWDKDVDTVDFRTFSRALALLDLKVDPQDALALFDEFEPEEGSVSLDDLEYKLRVNAGLLKEGAAEPKDAGPPRVQRPGLPRVFRSWRLEGSGRAGSYQR